MRSNEKIFLWDSFCKNAFAHLCFCSLTLRLAVLQRNVVVHCTCDISTLRTDEERRNIHDFAIMRLLIHSLLVIPAQWK